MNGLLRFRGARLAGALTCLFTASACAPDTDGGASPVPAPDASTGDVAAPDARPDAGTDAGDPDRAAGPDSAPDGPPGEGGSTDAEGGTPADGFLPRDGLDPGGRARRVDDPFWIAGNALLSDGAGRSWLYWHGFDTDSAQYTSHLDHFDANGSFTRSSALAALSPDGIALHGDGALSAWRNRCGPVQADVCFQREAPGGSIAETAWTAQPRTVTRYELDWDGNVVGPVTSEFTERILAFALGKDDGLYALTHHGSRVLHRLDARYESVWSVELWPAVTPPPLPPEPPLEDLIRAADLAQQLVTGPAQAEGGVVVAATVGLGTVAALKSIHGLDWPLPVLGCPDVLVARVADGGGAPRLFGISTPACEHLPKLAVVGNHAFVTTVLSVPKPPEPNDTSQYDIGLSIVDLVTGTVKNRQFGFVEDDWVEAIAPCGSNVCLAGTTGARSVDTGSVVTYGKGFVLPVSLTGVAGQVWHVTSPRHAVIQHLAPGRSGLLFFATVNGPITHTADQDPLLGFNEGLLGLIDGI